MAALVTRAMMNSRKVSDGGNVQNVMEIRDVKDFVPIVGRQDTPLVKKIKFAGTTDILKYEHGQGELSPTSTTMTGAHTNVQTTITVGNPVAVQQYDVLRYGTERMLVLDASPANPITVRRGISGSTAVAFTGGETIYIDGPAVPEGVDTPSSPFTQGDLDWDTFQIIEYSWSLTHRSRVIPTYEFKGDKFREMTRRYMIEATKDLENFAIHGLRALPANTTEPTTTRGAIQATSSNVTDLNGDPLTLLDFLDNQQAVFMDVGLNDMGHDVILGPTEKRIVNSWFNKARLANVSEAKMNATWDSVETDFGTYTFTIHHNWPSGSLHILNLKDIERRALEGGNWVTGVLSTQGWYDRGFLRGDMGFIWPVARRRSAVIDFSTSAADYDLDQILGNAA